METSLAESVRSVIADVAELERAMRPPHPRPRAPAFPAFAGMDDLFRPSPTAERVQHENRVQHGNRRTYGGRIVVINSITNPMRTPHDHVVLVGAQRALRSSKFLSDLPCLCSDAVTAADRLRADLAVTVVVWNRSYLQFCGDAMGVLIAVCADLQEQRRVALPPDCRPSTPPAALLHDVMSTLQGYDRRRAAAVCKQWRRAACDPLLPVSSACVTAWFRPRLAEMKRVSAFKADTFATMVAWAVTRHWLQQLW